MAIPLLIPGANPQVLPARVFVYRNLHRHGPHGEPIYSVRDVATGRVVAHTPSISLRDVEFVVSPAGRDRVRCERRKNVHAGVRGVPVAHQCGALRQARYNPYDCDTFVDRDSGDVLRVAALAVVDSSGVRYAP